MGPWYSASIWALMTSFHNAIAAVGKIRTGLCELSRRLVASGILLRLQRQQMFRVHAEAKKQKPSMITFCIGYDATTSWFRSKEHPSHRLQTFLSESKAADETSRAQVNTRKGKQALRTPTRLQHAHSMVQTAQVHVNDMNVHEHVFIAPRRVSTTSAMHTGACIISTMVSILTGDIGLLQWLTNMPYRICLCVFHADNASGNRLYHKMMRAVQWKVASSDVWFLFFHQPCGLHLAVGVLTGFLDRQRVFAVKEKYILKII